MLAAAGLCGVASAQDASANSAEDVLLAAATLSSAGNQRDAASLLREARERISDPRIDLSLATSLAETGSLLEAYEILRVLADGDSNPLLTDVARQRLAEIDGRLPELVVRVRGAMLLGARAVLDGRRRVRFEGTIARVRMDPGVHRLELRTETDAPIASQVVTIGEGERRELSIGPFASEEPLPLAPIVPRVEVVARVLVPIAARNNDDVWLWIAGGVAATALLATLGVVLGVVLSAPQPFPGDFEPVHVGGMP